MKCGDLVDFSHIKHINPHHLSARRTTFLTVFDCFLSCGGSIKGILSLINLYLVLIWCKTLLCARAATMSTAKNSYSVGGESAATVASLAAVLGLFNVFREHPDYNKCV